MQLRTVRVTNFRSVADSEEFEVDRVTCLVGKNEAGKSALLLALAALNPNDATPVSIDRERDYPRRDLVRYHDIHGDTDAVVVRTTWTLCEAETQAIAEDVGKDVLKSLRVQVSRRYGGEIEVDAQLDCMASVQHHCDLFTVSDSDRSALRSAETLEDLIDALDQLESPTEEHQALRAHLKERGGVRDRVRKHVVAALPTFMYVSSYDRMDGAVPIERTRQEIEQGQIDRDERRGARLFVDFLEYAGVALDDIVDVPTYETFNARLQAASSNITAQVLEYWSQNPDLDVDVKIDAARTGDPPPFDSGTIARARIKNNIHRVDTPFSERSAGFVWFFSFLVKFAQVQKAGGSVVLLLDEPGLSLHGKAQRDLLRFLDEQLAPSHQVIYTTHSPFMVPADQLQRVRIVEDRVDVGTKNGMKARRSDGTKVSQDVLKVGPDTLFPLQGALGYEVAQTLFVGEHTLLVEGPSDVLYLQALSGALKERNRIGLDARWTMCPAGGIDRMMPFVSLFAGNQLHVAVLSDEAVGSKGKVERIRKADILRANHVFTVAQFVESAEADVEDVFHPEIYAEIVNESYSLPDAYRVTMEKLRGDMSTCRIVKKVETIFAGMPAEIREFDHFTPALWLIRHPEQLRTQSDGTEETLSLAEAIFEAVNALLD